MAKIKLREKIPLLFKYYGMSFSRYMATRFIPASATAFFLVFFLIPHVFPIITELKYTRYLFYAIPFYISLSLFMYPLSQAMRKRREIEERIHLAVTKMAVMAAAGIPREDIIRSIAADPTYGEISEIFSRVLVLVDKWKISLARSLRLIAEEVISDTLRDFMMRLASAIEVGENLSEFLEKEQKVMLVEYETRYRTSLELANILREIYVSTLVSTMFLLSFLVIVPVLAGGDPLVYLFSGIMAYAVMEGIIYYLLRIVLPEESLYGKPRHIVYEFDKTLTRFYLPITIIMSFILGTLFYFLVPAGLFVQYWPLFISTSLLPFSVVGALIYKDEKKVRDRDKNYEVYIRVLGAAAIASAEGLTGAVGRVLSHDFGELTPLIKNLYKRLRTRINKVMSWEYFMDESGSWLIQTFTKMFVDSVNLGGNPDLVSRLITDSISRILSLRTERQSLVSNITGILYGLAVGVAMSMAVLVQMMGMLNKTMSQVTLAGLPIQIPIFAVSYDLSITSFLVVSVIAVHAAFSGLILRDLSGGHRFSPLLHLVVIFWVAAAVYTIMQNVMSIVLGI
ncbi:MAG TPA: hypothetical protein ENF25_01970 [Thermoprotei archaeon]|nr:hypothetical protein [Thermoprotei archaeon]